MSTDKMTAPTPAAVRWAMRINYDEGTPEERAAYFADERGSEDMLADHIRAIAQEMRAESIAMLVNTHDPFVEPGTREAEIAAAKLLAVFADKLEGKQ